MLGIWVDHRPRIQFYVTHGLVREMPTDRQLRTAAKLNFAGAGVVERLRYFAGHPLELLPFRRRALAENAAVLAGNDYDLSPGAAAERQGLDRVLSAAFEVSAIRFAVQTLYNPWNPVPATGLHIPTWCLVNHVVHAPHPTAVWDVQIIHADPGGLEALEHQIELAAHGTGMRSRIFRAMAGRPGYYDYLGDLARRVRKFDYPPTPPHFVPKLENLVNFLNHALEL